MGLLRTTLHRGTESHPPLKLLPPNNNKYDMTPDTHLQNRQSIARTWRHGHLPGMGMGTCPRGRERQEKWEATPLRDSLETAQEPGSIPIINTVANNFDQTLPLLSQKLNESPRWDRTDRAGAWLQARQHSLHILGEGLQWGKMRTSAGGGLPQGQTWAPGPLQHCCGQLGASRVGLRPTSR